MYDIDVCYKLIFCSMFEEDVLGYIAKEVYAYTGAGIFCIDVSGTILSYACPEEEKKISSVKEEKILLEDYRAFFARKNVEGEIITSVYKENRMAGYIVLTFADAENRRFFQELGDILAQATGKFFGKKQVLFPLPLEEQVAARAIFAGKQYAASIMGLNEGYIAAVFLKASDWQENRLFNPDDIWSYYYIYEEEFYVDLFLYSVGEDDMDGICRNIERMELNGCVSERFNDISICRAKLNFLKRIAAMRGTREDKAVKREKDWYLPGLFSYTSPLIKEAGLCDYSILRLIEEDRKNKTELYNTLKMYLLCENNITVAAENLYIHRNTLVYRLRQIKECIGIDVNDNEVSRELLAFAMMYDTAAEADVATDM